MKEDRGDKSIFENPLWKLLSEVIEEVTGDPQDAHLPETVIDPEFHDLIVTKLKGELGDKCFLVVSEDNRPHCMTMEDYLEGMLPND
jgi:hypothetical protein